MPYRKYSAGTVAAGPLASAVCVMLILLGSLWAPVARADDQQEIDIALSLAKLLQSARSVISANQALINDPSKGDKGLTGEVVLAAAVAAYAKATGTDLNAIDASTREGQLLKAEMASIKEVVDDNQDFINQKGVAFKGFIPAVFGRLVTEKMQAKVGTEMLMKVTAPPDLVRNRKARPDDWEKMIIETKFLSPSWTKGQIFSQAQPYEGRDAFRVMVPEYYAPSCLSCHGPKKGEMDITGYPKEGANAGDLGGIISITLFRQQD